MPESTPRAYGTGITSPTVKRERREETGLVVDQKGGEEERTMRRGASPKGIYGCFPLCYPIVTSVLPGRAE